MSLEGMLLLRQRFAHFEEYKASKEQRKRDQQQHQLEQSMGWGHSRVAAQNKQQQQLLNQRLALLGEEGTSGEELDGDEEGERGPSFLYGREGDEDPTNVLSLRSREGQHFPNQKKGSISLAPLDPTRVVSEKHTTGSMKAKQRVTSELKSQRMKKDEENRLLDQLIAEKREREIQLQRKTNDQLRRVRKDAAQERSKRETQHHPDQGDARSEQLNLKSSTEHQQGSSYADVASTTNGGAPLPLHSILSGSSHHRGSLDLGQSWSGSFLISPTNGGGGANSSTNDYMLLSQNPSFVAQPNGGSASTFQDVPWSLGPVPMVNVPAAQAEQRKGSLKS